MYAGASENLYAGASENLYAGASERAFGGASEQLVRAPGETSGSYPTALGAAPDAGSAASAGAHSKGNV
jgi:hypothetical protein